MYGHDSNMSAMVAFNHEGGMECGYNGTGCMCECQSSDHNQDGVDTTGGREQHLHACGSGCADELMSRV